MATIVYVPAPGYDASEKGTLNLGNGVVFDIGAALTSGSGQISVDSSTNPTLVNLLDHYPGLIRSGNTPGPVVIPDSIAPVLAHSGTNPQVGDLIKRGPDGIFTPQPRLDVSQLPPSAVTDSSIGAAPRIKALASSQTKLAKIVGQPLPAVGASITIATLTGAGVIRNLWLAIGVTALAKNGRLQVFVDGEVIPSIDVDVGTLFCFQEEGALSTGAQFFTQNVNIGMGYNIGSPTAGVISAALRFPIPYSNGAIIKFYNPSETATTPFNQIFGQVAYESGAIPGVTDRWRLRGLGLPYARAAPWQKTQVASLFDLTNAAGVLAYFSTTMKGSSNAVDYTFLERPFDLWIDGEGSPSYQSSGAEDFFNLGWYFDGLTYSNPFSMVTCNWNGNNTLAAAVDLLELVGGIRFTNELKMALGSSDEIKTPGLVTSEHIQGFSALWYCDTAQPFAPGAPQSVVAAPQNGGATITWKQPSQGSQPVTSFTVTATASGQTTVTQTVTTLSATLTGMTNGVAYNISVTATNSIGTSPAGTTTVTPVASGSYDTAALALPSVVAYLKFGESSGTAAADSAGSNNGSYVGVPSLGLPGATSDNAGAVWFNYVGQYVSVPDAAALKLAAPFAFACWILLVRNSAYPVILGKSSDGSYTGSDYGWQLNNTTRKPQLVVASNASAPAASTAIPQAVWTHIGVSYDLTNVRYYLNGQPDGAPAFTTATKTSTGVLTIGSWLSYAASQATIRIHKLAICAAKPSDAQFLALYNAR